MSNPRSAARPDTVRGATVTLDLPEGSLELQVHIPGEPERLIDFALKTLPLSDAVADMAGQEAERLGFSISCTKGCGACCRQLVPLSPPEAGMMYEYVHNLPKSQHVRIVQRFRMALEHLDRDGFLNTLRDTSPAPGTDETARNMAREYFSRSIPCPFLEDEACSIYELRPSMCREYLVTSPPELCRTPYEAQVRRLPLSIRLSEALARTWASCAGRQVQVIPSILALQWTEENPGIRGLKAPGQELLINVLGHLSELVQSRSAEEAPSRSPDLLPPGPGDSLT